MRRVSVLLLLAAAVMAGCAKRSPKPVDQQEQSPAAFVTLREATDEPCGRMGFWHKAVNSHPNRDIEIDVKVTWFADGQQTRTDTHVVRSNDEKQVGCSVQGSAESRVGYQIVSARFAR